MNKIYNFALEDIMGKRFGDYSKAIIQDRALPDVRDGLKPVQRRILYAMYKGGHTYDKPTVKSARSVGDIMGKYHPHGDSSIYEAMVRMSQWWKSNTPYIDMQGNNGSMDGDSAAAMRYTEARLSKISNELLKDINKDTVPMVYNFDDTLFEPTVLPAKFPNLLVNGATGISAGYATNIPPHNLGEVIDATIKRIDKPDCTLEEILEIVKGPDFPTGAIVEGKNGLIDAYKTGRGRVILKSKVEFNKDKNKEQIVIKEIPFDVNKALLVKKIDEIRIDKKIEGISEVRDESYSEEPERIVIDLKKDADKELVLNYLLKNTELQISYNFNMVAIVNKRPMTIGILKMLDSYIAHQREVILRRTNFDLEASKAQIHILEGLIKAISILDEVIATIRASKNKSDAEKNLCEQYGFSEKQSEAIVKLQLYRLTNTDITSLEEEYNSLLNFIKGLEAILNDENKLKSLMKHELKKIKDEYGTDRKTEIKDEITEIKIDTTKMIPKEDTIVVVTNEGYLKRVSIRSFEASDGETGLKDGDYVIGKYKMSTMDTVLLFTDLGNYLYIPVYEIPDLKWKDLGKHVSNIIPLKQEEKVIKSILVNDFEEDICITSFTRNGMVKRTKLSEYKALRYSKPIISIKLKDNDRVVTVTNDMEQKVFVATKRGYGLTYLASEIPVTGLKSSGVKAIQLKDDEVVSAHIFGTNMEYLTVITSKNTAKRIKLSEFDLISRARKGVLIIREVKTNPYYILKTFIIPFNKNVGAKLKENIKIFKITEFPIADRYSLGSTISKEQIIDVFNEAELIDKKELKNIPEKENISLESIDEKMLTIDDFLKELDS